MLRRMSDSPTNPHEASEPSPGGQTAPGVAGELRRVLGPFSAGAIVVGGVIGSGIFFKPQEVALGTGGHLGLILTLWLVCGLVNLCGALTLAELSAMLPHAGGTYVFLRESYGRTVAFMWGWAEFWVIRSGGMAALAVAMTMTLNELLAEMGWRVPSESQSLFLKGIAIGTITLLSIINVIGVWHGGVVQNVTTVIKAAFVAFLGALPFVAVRAVPVASATVTDVSLWPETFNIPLLVGIGTALSGVMWAYDGWGNVTVVAEEIKQPQRSVPLALGGGVILLTVLYLGANVGYHTLLPMETIQTTECAAKEAMGSWLGPLGSKVLLVMLIISIFGALNSNILIGPRVFYAVARDQPALSLLSRLDPRTATPVFSIVGLSTWAVVLIVVSDVTKSPGERLFDVLTAYCVFGGSLFYLAAVVGVFALRRRRPDAPRPYRTWGYPMVPLVFAVFYVFLLVSLFAAKPTECVTGLGLILLGLAAYPFVRGRS